MDGNNQVPKAAVGVRREMCVDPVKAQGILSSVGKKERHAARQWAHRWGFLSRTRELREEETLKLGICLEEYKAAIHGSGCESSRKAGEVHVESNPEPVPETSSGMIGRRVRYTLEKFGPLVESARDYPIRPAPPTGQAYDPYKQTMVFLGSVDGDPISHKQSAARCEVTDDMWAEPQQLTVTPVNFDSLTFKHNM